MWNICKKKELKQGELYGGNSLTRQGRNSDDKNRTVKIVEDRPTHWPIDELKDKNKRPTELCVRAICEMVK